MTNLSTLQIPFRYGFTSDFNSSEPFIADVSFNLDDEYERESLAYDVAMNYYNANYDNWDSATSKTFFIWEANGSFVGEYDIELEFSPVFTIWEK